MSHCTSCGNQLADSDKFCPNCGRMAEKQPPAAARVERRRKSMPRRAYILSAVAIIVVIALIVALGGPALERTPAITDRAEGVTADWGGVDFFTSMADEDEVQIRVVVEDKFTGQPVEGIAVELVVTDTTLDVLFHDPQGDYLPGIFVFDQERLDDYPEIRSENPIIITLLGIGVAAVKAAGLYLFVKGGITIMAGGTVSLVKSALTGLAISLAAEGLWALTKHLATPASPKDAINYPVTIYIFEEPAGDYATHTINVPEGVTWEEIDEAVRGVTGDIELKIVWPAKNPAKAYYHPDGTPKVLYVYPVEEAVQAEYTLAVSSTAGGSVTTPGEGTFTYDAGTVVILTANPASGYRFVDWTGDVGTIADVDAAATTITMNDRYSITANFEEAVGYTPMVAAGFAHTVGLKSDGTVVAVGGCWRGECDLGEWADIVQVAAGGWHTVGLKSDGTVVAAGRNDEGQCNVGDWKNIVQISADSWHTVGLKSDGTVVAVGRNDDGQCKVSGWTGIVQVAAGVHAHTVGLKSDGTVVAVGRNYFGQCNVGDWTDIIQIAAGSQHTVGLKSDGTVVGVGRDGYFASSGPSQWTGIVQVAAASMHTLGLKSDGTVVIVGGCILTWMCNVGGWTDVVQVAMSSKHTVGLKSDGTVVAEGPRPGEVGYYGQCSVDDWNLN